MAEQQSNRWEVHTIVQREGQNGGEGKAFWVKVGSAFTNKDGSINVFLDAFPVNGKLQLRVPQPREEQAPPPQNQRPAPAQQPPRGRGQQGGGNQW